MEKLTRRGFLAAMGVMATAFGMAACAQGTIPSHESDAAATELPDATAEIADVTSVAYLGPAGTYTEEAAKLFFGDNDELLP